MVVSGYSDFIKVFPLSTHGAHELIPFKHFHYHGELIICIHFLYLVILNLSLNRSLQFGIVKIEYFYNIREFFLKIILASWYDHKGFFHRNSIWKNLEKGRLTVVLIILFFKISLLGLCSCKYKTFVISKLRHCDAQKIRFLRWLIAFKLCIEMSTVAQLASALFKKKQTNYAV